MIGTELASRRLQTSRPSSRGSIRSRTTRSTCSEANRRSASSPSRACSTRYRPARAGTSSSFCTESSSSTRRMVEGSGMAFPARRPGAAAPRPTIASAMSAVRSAPRGAGPARLAGTAGQRAHVPRHVADRRAAAARCGVLGRPAAGASRHRRCRPPSTSRPRSSSPRTWRGATPTASRDARRGRSGGLGRRRLRRLRLRRGAAPVRGDDPGRRPRAAREPRRQGPGRSTRRSSSWPPRRHRLGPGADDNASGTAALVELARTYARRAGPQLEPRAGRRALHDLLLVSTDGGASERSARAVRGGPRPPRPHLAVIVLDSLAGRGRRDCSSPATGRDRRRRRSCDGRERMLEETGTSPVDRALSASSSTSRSRSASTSRRRSSTRNPGDHAHHGRRPAAAAFTDTPEALDPNRLGELGAVGAGAPHVDRQGFQIAPERSGYVYLGTRIVRGWAVQLVLIATLLRSSPSSTSSRLPAAADPARAGAAELWAAASSSGSYLGLLFGALRRARGLWPTAPLRPIAPGATGVTNWPMAGVVLLLVLAAAGWVVARHRLVPRRHRHVLGAARRPHGGAVALAVLTLVVVATNAYALVFLLPSVHAWLWLPQFADRPAGVRAASSRGLPRAADPGRRVRLPVRAGGWTRPGTSRHSSPWATSIRWPCSCCSRGSPPPRSSPP